jgi:hypothetical protein
MLRWLYIQLIWLHPALFRWRFGDDMLDDFDRSTLRARPRYFADAVASLARQWLLRPEFRAESMPVAADASLGTLAVPLFQTIGTYKPHPAALLQGGLLAILSISLALHGPSLLPIHRNSMTGIDLNTTVKLRRNPFGVWLNLARPYFVSMPVLGALDDDRDLTISPWEIVNARRPFANWTLTTMAD